MTKRGNAAARMSSADRGVVRVRVLLDRTRSLELSLGALANRLRTCAGAVEDLLAGLEDSVSQRRPPAIGR